MKANSKMMLAIASLVLAGAASAQSAAVLTAYKPWMSSEIIGAWSNNYYGQGASVKVIDQFAGDANLVGKLGENVYRATHGYWTTTEARMLAPRASYSIVDFSNTAPVSLAATGLNVMNLSYSMNAASGYSVSSIAWGAREKSIIDHAGAGRAVVAKAAGNNNATVDGATSTGSADYLNKALVGKQSAIFVGALDRNGTTTSKANKASYSNYAGNNAQVQKNFLMVGVESSKTGLAGTSFAAPIVSGYAAIVGSKFRTASATTVANQLLNTARVDTIANYNPAIHGRGEASIARALAPVAIQ